MSTSNLDFESIFSITKAYFVIYGKSNAGASLITPKSKRNKGLTIMLLPLMMCIFIMGFFMSSIGAEKRTSKTKCKPLENDSISIMPIVLEEREIISA